MYADISRYTGGKATQPTPAPTPAPPQKLSKLEMLKYAKEKKRLAKIDAKFQKKIKKKGY